MKRQRMKIIRRKKKTEDHDEKELKDSKIDIESVKKAEEFFLLPFEEWRKQMKIEKMILIGHSMGGYLSTVYGLAHPDRIIRLILLSPVGVPESPPDFEERFAARAKEDWKLRTAQWLWKSGTTPQQLVRNLEWLGVSKWLTSSVVKRRFKHLDLDTESLKAISGYLHSISVLPRSGEDCLVSILKFGAWAIFPLKHRIEESLKVPTAFVYGDIDWMSPSTARTLARNSRLSKVISDVYVIPEGGHHMYLENPVDSNRVICEEVLIGVNSVMGPVPQQKQAEGLESAN